MEKELAQGRRVDLTGGGLLRSAGKYRRVVEARSFLCYWAVRELGVPMSSLARKLGISIPSVSDSVTRGQRIADAKGFFLQRYAFAIKNVRKIYVF